MAAADLIACSVITPERMVLETAASAVVFSAHDGLMGVLRNRAPLVCQLGIGELRVDTPDAGSKHFFIDGGFAQVLHNNVAILTERAISVEQLSRADAQKALAAAEAMPARNDADFSARQDALQRARIQLKLATQ